METPVEQRLTQLRTILNKRMGSDKFSAIHTSQQDASPKVIALEEEHELMGVTTLELFVGEAGLTQAVSRAGLPLLEPGEIRTGARVVVGTNLLCNQTFRDLKARVNVGA